MDIQKDKEIELWDIYDRNRVLTDRLHRRGEPLREDEYHLVVHVCIFNSKNQMLIQKRQPWKEGWPGMWDLSVGGSALAGEDSIAAAERETREELGYEIDLSDERPYFTINFEHGFDDYYMVEREIAIEELSPQYEEVESVKWADREEILEMMRKGEFIPYYIVDVLFEMRGRRGAIRV